MLNLIGRAQAAISETNLPKLAPITNTATSLSNIVVKLINGLLIIAGILAAIYLIYGGVLYITAGGEAEKATKGRTAVINAVIGIVIILIAIIIVQWVNNLVKNGTV